VNCNRGAGHPDLHIIPGAAENVANPSRFSKQANTIYLEFLENQAASADGLNAMTEKLLLGSTQTLDHFVSNGLARLAALTNDQSFAERSSATIYSFSRAPLEAQEYYSSV
jgi:hypothetical protein